MDSIVILVKEKTLYIHLGEMLKKAELTISDVLGAPIHTGQISQSNYEIITLDQPPGKYWLKIKSDKLKTKKSFHLN